jgi:peptidoglycan/xylan/chitin deacetylase (PgdA/CDA1 family)
MRFPWFAITALLLLPVLAGGGCGAATAKGIPPKTVVLTFDDACRSHLEVAVPILEKHGFGATFFVTQRWMSNRRLYLGFGEITQFAERGFEVGTHTWDHGGYHLPNAAELLPADLDRLEKAMADVGLPKPVSFAWPGGVFGPEGRQVLESRGYLFGRRVIHPEFPPGVTREGLVYDPAVNDPYLIPTYGLVNDSWTLEHFAEVVAKATAGRAVVLGFHGIPDPANPGLSTSPPHFERLMEHLAAGGYHVVAMRDLARWVDPSARPPDPLVGKRCPE